MSGSAVLLLLFVVLPVVLGVIVIALVGRRGATVPPELRTSSLLREGEPARAELLSWKRSGAIFLDRRPMVALRLDVRPTAGDAFELTVVQCVPAPLMRELKEGMALEVRLSPDRTTGAVVLSD